MVATFLTSDSGVRLAAHAAGPRKEICMNGSFTVTGVCQIYEKSYC